MKVRPKRVTFAEAPLKIIDGDRGKAYPSRQEFQTTGYCLFLNTGNVTGQGFDFSSCDYISEERDRLLRKGRVLRGDIVLTTRGTVGNVAFFDEHIEVERIRINSGMVIFRCDVTHLLPDYLFYFLRGRDFKGQVASLVTGSAQPQLPIKDIQQIEIPIPSLADQKRIVSIINSFERRLLSNRRLGRILEEMSQALFKSWFVDFDPVVAKSEGRKPFGMSDDLAALFPDSFEESELGAVPKGWRVESLENLCEFGSGKRPPTPGFDSCGEIPIIGGGGPMGLCEKPLLTTSALITGRVGTLGLVFRVDYPCWPSDNTLIIYPSPGYFDFVFFVARNADLASLNRGSTQPLLTQGDLRAIRCVKPPEKLVLEFQRLTSVLFAKISATGRETKALQRARDALLPELLGGRIVKSSQLTEATAA